MIYDPRPAASAPRPRSPLWKLVGRAVLLCLSFLLSLGSASLLAGTDVAAAGPDPVAVEGDDSLDRLARPGGAIAWGTVLDWQNDNAADYTSRLGVAPAVFAKDAPLPLDDANKLYVQQFLEQTSRQGGTALLSLQPLGGLSTVKAGDIADTAAFLGEQADRLAVPLLLSIAPEMNAPWRTWGQQPAAYRELFRAVSAAVRTDAPMVRTLWAPADGADYPFRSVADTTGMEPEVLTHLDTNSDGSLGPDDDAYLPYYPGDDVVDWVGLVDQYGNVDDLTTDNAVAPAGTFEADLAGADGAPTDPDNFCGRFATSRNKPLLVETAARFVHGGPGATEVAVKQGWWRQTFDATTARRFPALAVVVWRELGTASDGRTDLRVTASAPLAQALRADMTTAGVELGEDVSPAVAPVVDPGKGPIATGAVGWLVSAGVALAGIGLLVMAFRPTVRKLHYVESTPRDLRVDLLRGVAIVFVVVNHINIPSLYQVISQEALGAISGAELFVLLSGAVLGMVYRPRMDRDGFGNSAVALVKRAWKLYYTALVVVVSVYLLSLIPGVDARALTTFTDQGTGAAGGQAAGTVYQLYGSMDLLLTYPVPPSVFADVLLLRIGPWQFNVIGLYVVLLLLAPLMLWLLRRRLVLVVLGASWALYIASAIHPIRILPSQFEDSFPLMTWQVLFVHGMVAGFYRHALLGFFRRPWGRVVLVGVLLSYLAFLFFTWNNPYQANAFDPRLALIPDDVFRGLYQSYFTRTHLGPGRLINVFFAVITLYALLTAYWKPINAALGRFLTPLGQASLYVFIMHVYFAVLMANIPALREGSILLNTAAYTVVLAALWLMVKRRFLFRWVPR
ncbi:OpgC domain-containing protein [Nakamurella sp. GG22]